MNEDDANEMVDFVMDDLEEVCEEITIVLVVNDIKLEFSGPVTRYRSTGQHMLILTQTPTKEELGPGKIYGDDTKEPQAIKSMIMESYTQPFHEEGKLN